MSQINIPMDMGIAMVLATILFRFQIIGSVLMEKERTLYRRIGKVREWQS